jgi:hypothetical protein
MGRKGARQTGGEAVRRARLLTFSFAAVLLAAALSAPAHIQVSYSLARIISDSSNILLMNVEQVDREKNLIILRKLRDIKGTHPGEVIRHDIGKRGYSAIEWQNVMQSVDVGKPVVMFHNGSIAEVCTDRYWYQARAGEWWTMVHDEPIFLLSFAGSPDKLATAVAGMLQGQEVTVPCMAPVQGSVALSDRERTWVPLRSRRGKMLKMKASMKLLDYNFNRDFVAWGGDQEYKPVNDMPGFTHSMSLGLMGAGTAGIEAGDLDRDGRPDLCIFTAGKVQVFKNDGDALTDMTLPVRGGARGAAWADFNGDRKTDLFVAGTAGPRLFFGDGTNLTDATASLPPADYPNFTAAAKLDFDGDGRMDLVLADGFRGLRLYRNNGGQTNAATQSVFGPWYYAGPFDNSGNCGFATAFPPEQGVSLNAEYVGKNGEKVVWRKGNFKDAHVNNLALFKPELNVNSVVYLYREIDIAGGVDMPVSLGCDDNLTVWLNGGLVTVGTAANGCRPDEFTPTLKLGPGRNVLLLKVCQLNNAFAFSFSARDIPPPAAPLFEDISDSVGLGLAGMPGDARGDCLSVADVDGDKRPDILLCAGSGMLFLNKPGGFIFSPNSGISFETGGVSPAFGDADGDGKVDLFVPQKNKPSRLFINIGGGKFRDATTAIPVLRSTIGWATTAVWCDLQGRGRQNLLVGCLKGPNRYFTNNGKGIFEDAGEDTGLDRKILNTRCMAALDVNGDRMLDVVLGNDGQNSLVLLGAGEEGGAHESR